MTRATAEKALREFLGRVDQVNKNSNYLGKVARVILFGSMLKPAVERVSDVDLAVEIVPKEANRERARMKNYQHAAQLEQLGYRFRGFLDRDFCWYWEVFDFLKGRSRVVSLIDLKREGEFVLAAPHKLLYEESRWSPDAPPRVITRRRCAKISDENEWF